MAANKLRLSDFFYIIMSVLALNFLVVASYLLIAVYGLKFMTVDDLRDIGLVLVGNRKYALNLEQLRDYQEMLAAREKAAQELEDKAGGQQTREKTAAALSDMALKLKVQQDNFQALKKANEDRLLTLHGQIDKLRQDSAKAKKELEDWKVAQEKSRLSDRTAQLEKTYRAMEPDLIAQQMANLPPDESARIIRDYLTPVITAEVLGAVPPAIMGQILPFMENKYANIAPEMVVRRWTTPNTDDTKNPEQMALYLRRMRSEEAFQVFFALPERLRPQVARFLLNLQEDAMAP